MGEVCCKCRPTHHLLPGCPTWDNWGSETGFVAAQLVADTGIGKCGLADQIWATGRVVYHAKTVCCFSEWLCRSMETPKVGISEFLFPMQKQSGVHTDYRLGCGRQKARVKTDGGCSFPRQLLQVTHHASQADAAAALLTQWRIPHHAVREPTELGMWSQDFVEGKARVQWSPLNSNQ